MTAPKVFISHESALEFWRHHDLDPSGGIKRTRITSVRDGSATLRDIKPLVRQAMPTSGRIFGATPEDSLLACLSDLDIDNLPLHVMVGDKSQRRSWSSIESHLYAKPLPEGSFCRISARVYVTSPELTLCQLATKLPFVDLLELCMEFCSGYTLNPESERGFDDRPALTSSARLSSFVRKLKGRHGAKQIRPVLNYVVDDSASPMETITLMLLCLPSKLGGYQLPLPEHNVSIPITERAKSHTKRKHLICDLYWSEFNLDVECDSTTHHSSKEQLGIDSDRRIILDAMEYSYVGITWWQLEHKEEFANVVQALRRAMNLQLREAPEHIALNREALRTYLTTTHGERKPLRLIRRRK